MVLSPTELVLWCTTFLLECVACFLAFWRKLDLRIRIFPAYLALLVARELFLYWVYQAFGYSSRFAFYAYWTTQGLALLLRAGAIAEIIWKASRRYPGFRLIAGWLVAVVSALLLARACWIVVHNVTTAPGLILGVEHQFEFTAAVVLFVLFVLWARYDVPLGRPEKNVAVGLWVYSLIQEVNNVISQHWLRPYFHWGDTIRVVSFMAVLIVWIVALTKPLPSPIIQTQPAPLSDIREYMRYGTALLEKLYMNLRRFRKTGGRN
jgi:hypothetical protein